MPRNKTSRRSGRDGSQFKLDGDHWYKRQTGKKVDWMKSCVIRERIMDWFLEEPENCTKVSCFHNPGMCIDALHFLQPDCNLLAAGDRGGTLSLFALTDLLKDSTSHPILSNGHTHKGWIWSITSEADLIASTSWDGKLRLWAYGGTMQSPLTEFKLGSAVLCSEFLDTNLIAATAFHGPVTVYDVRAPPTEIALSSNYHKSAVLTLKSFHSLSNESTQDQFLPTLSERSDDADDDDDFSLSDSISLVDIQSAAQAGPIADQGDELDAEANSELLDLSPSGDGVPSVQGQQEQEQEQQQAVVSKDVTFFTGSQDRLLGAWDIRNFQTPLCKRKFRGFPRAISLLDSEEMWVAEVPNRLHVCSIGQREPEVLRPGGKTRKIPFLGDVNVFGMPERWKGFGNLQVTPGAVFLTGLPGDLAVLHPTIPPLPMTSTPVHSEIGVPPVCLAYRNEVLVVGHGNGSMRLWMSKDRADALLLKSTVSLV
nr:unnamed protein product [Spirometra erinaceieuropaei]